MFLSIITCTYNSEKYLQKCIDSVVAQNLNPDEFEHIFVDGFSNDKTMKIIEQYKNKYTNYHIKVIQRPAKGIYNAMNEGIKEAKGKYLNMLNSDDYWEPGKILGYIDFIKNDGEKKIYCAYTYIINLDGTRYERDAKYKGTKLDLQTLIEENSICHQSTFYQRKLHNLVGFYDESFRVCGDYKFWLLLADKNITPIWYKDYIVNFRIGGASKKYRGRQQIEHIQCQKPFLNKFIYIKELLKVYVVVGATIFTKKIGLYNKLSPIYRKYILKQF